MKRYTLIASDGVRERVSEDMFDFNVGAALNRITNRGTWASRFQVARELYARPTFATFVNVGAALERLHANDPKRFLRHETIDSVTYRFRPDPKAVALVRRNLNWRKR